MKVGDRRREKPRVDSELMLADYSLRDCVVVYIHPLWRFYTVEFTTILGWKFRESYFFRDKRPDGPELPEEIRREREAREARRGSGRSWHSKPKIGVMHRPMYSR